MQVRTSVLAAALLLALAGSWQMRSFDGLTLPVAYSSFRDKPIGARILGLSEIPLDSAVMELTDDDRHVRRYYFSELHDGLLAYRYLWGDHGRMTLGGILARGAVSLVSEYIQNLYAQGTVYADRTLRLLEPLWIGEAFRHTTWELRASASAP